MWRIIRVTGGVSIDSVHPPGYNLALKKNMRILLTNDDGITAPGLIALYRGLAEFGSVEVVAPTTCRSGTSHSITYIEPLGYEEVTVAGHFTGIGVHGSPADCVKLAYHVLFEDELDLVVSGINDGANVGINMHYSGTVAAAMEAAFLGIPAVAVSVSSGATVDFDQAGSAACSLLKSLWPLQARDVINLNIPNPAQGPALGIRVAPQATEGFVEYYSVPEQTHAPLRRQLQAGPFQPTATPTDAALLAEGYITLTPLRADMTNHECIKPLHERLNGRTD